MLIGLWTAASLLSAAPALAEPQQCLGRGDSRWLVDQTLNVLVNPTAFENQLRVNACLPLTKRPGILFDYAQFETGFFNYISPVYVHVGTYASITPLSFLQFRADVAGLVIWPLPLDAAGYFGMDGYEHEVPDAMLPAANARSAMGANVTLSVNLQGAVPLTSWLELQVSNSFAGDYFYVGDKPYYFNQRRDIVLRQSDWLIKNTAFLMAEIRASPAVAVRLGAVDDLTFVPGSGELENQLFAFASVPIRRDADLRDIEPFVRAGAYTSHGWRKGFTMIAGISLAWALPMEKKPR